MENQKAANIEDVLRKHIGTKIEISYSYHEEGVLRCTTGVLRGLTKDLIVLEVMDKDHRWQRMKPHLYYMNRHACNLASIIIHDEKEVK